MGEMKPAAICNILGDQPLFYIDYVDQEDAELMDRAALEDAGIPAEYMADNIEDLQRRMARLEMASQHIDGYAREDADAAFRAATDALGKTEATPLTRADIDTIINSSGMMSALRADISAAGLRIDLSACVDTASYDRDGKTIFINPRLPVSVAGLVLARVLRQAWIHVKNGTSIHPLHFAPEEAILLNRIHKADLAVASIRAAWELNLSGDKSAWTRLLTVSAYDLATGFAREAITDFRALNNGNASHAAFERWFFSGRCKDVDRKLIQTMLADHHGLIFENRQVSRMVTGDIVARTGEMPMGKNYLTGLVETILADPLFTEVRDRSNANFLWFIRFERSFRDSEQEMEQSLHFTPARKTGSPSASDGTNDAAHASTGQESSVVAFTGAHARDRANGKNARAAAVSGGATVYYIDHFFGLPHR